jgi:hypothetical protein
MILISKISRPFIEMRFGRQRAKYSGMYNKRYEDLK